MIRIFELKNFKNSQSDFFIMRKSKNKIRKNVTRVIKYKNIKSLKKNLSYCRKRKERGQQEKKG